MLAAAVSLLGASIDRCVAVLRDPLDPLDRFAVDLPCLLVVALLYLLAAVLLDLLAVDFPRSSLGGPLVERSVPWLVASENEAAEMKT